jgi:hypothetical protein
MAILRVKMTRGGYMNLEVTGRVYKDSYGVPGSPVWTEVEIDSIHWPGGGEVADKNIADMEQVEEAFRKALKEERENF